MNIELYSAFERTVERRLISQVPKMPDHRFSSDFRRRIKQMTCSEESGEFIRRIPLKRFFAIIAIAPLTATIAACSAGGAPGFLKDLIMSSFPTHTIAAFPDTAEKAQPELIEYIYAIDVPEGFEVDFESDNVINRDTMYNCLYYNDKKDAIHISQIAKTAYNSGVNIEGKAIEYIEINGHKGFIVEINERICMITWDNGDYIMEIDTDLGRSAAIDIANSVHKRE